MIDFAMRQRVLRRARRRCEYCHLALACHQDNLRKGPNLTGIDPVTRKFTKLFNPRRHKWARHFRWDGPTLVGRTAVGRATVAVLGMNLSHRVALRQELIAAGRFPRP